MKVWLEAWVAGAWSRVGPALGSRKRALEVADVLRSLGLLTKWRVVEELA